MQFSNNAALVALLTTVAYAANLNSSRSSIISSRSIPSTSSRSLSTSSRSIPMISARSSSEEIANFKAHQCLRDYQTSKDGVKLVECLKNLNPTFNVKVEDINATLLDNLFPKNR